MGRRLISGPAGGSPETAAAASCASTGSGAASLLVEHRGLGQSGHDAPAREQPQDPDSRDLRNVGHVRGLEPRQRPEHRCAIGADDEDAVEQHGV